MLDNLTTEIIKDEPAAEEAVVLTPQESEDLKEMVAAGVLFGRKKSRTHPKMNKYIFTYSKGVAVFDFGQTLASLNKASGFLKEVYDKKLPILVVGTQVALKDLLETFAKKLGLTYVTERWLGGTLTNFQTISKRIDHFKKLKTDKAMGKLDKYTKKERLLIDRELEDMAISFTGIENLNQLPAVLFVVDAEVHETAVREAKKLNIPIVALINNDNNPDGLAYPIPANDSSRSSLTWILGKIEKGLTLING